MIYYGDIVDGDLEDFWIVTGKVFKFFFLIKLEAGSFSLKLATPLRRGEVIFT